MKPTKLTKRSPFHLAPVRLLVAAAADADVRADIETESGNVPRWLQIAEEGEFKGHPAGPFEMDQELFDELRTNFHAHPSFDPGADGVGTARVVAFDFGHASEDPPAATAVLGAPAQAWAFDIETRTVDGKLGLWSLTELLEPMATYAKQGKYAWTSVAIWPNAVDPKTDEEIGWYLSSIAFTNDPFIQGMVPIAAQRAALMGYYDPYYPPKDIDETIGAIRSILELPETSTVDDIAGELGKLRTFAAAPDSAPPGIDVDSLVSQFRQLLNLPLLTAPDDVFVELEKVLVVASSGAPAPAAPPPPAPALPPPAAPAMTTRHIMKDELLKKLAKRLGVPASEEEVETKILAALDEGQVSSSTLSKLLGLLGVKNLEQATAKLQELIGFKDLMPTIEGLLEGEVAAEEKEVDEDVAAVAATYQIPEIMKRSLRVDRIGGVEKLEIDGCLKVPPGGTSPLVRRREAREAFRAQYPEAFVRADQQHLLAPIATNAPKSPLLRAIHGTPQGGIALGRQPALPAPAPGLGGGADEQQTQEILRCAGRNYLEKAQNWLRAQPGGDKAAYDDIHQDACLLSRRLKLQERSVA